MLIQRLYDATVGRLIDTHIRNHLLFKKLVFGDPSRLTIAKSALVNNALFNTMSGRIDIGEHVFFGHNVCLLTGTHDIAAAQHLRKTTIPSDGRDIAVQAGAWLASNTTILGPCVVGEMAIVAAGAVVIDDVPPFAIVAGVPARVVGSVPQPRETVTLP